MSTADDANAPPDDSSALRDELAGLVTERVDATLTDLDLMSTAELVQLMNAGDHEVPIAVARAAGAVADAVDLVVERLRRGGRLLYVGCGTPGRLGVLDASECPPTFGTDPRLVVGVIGGGDTAVRNAVEGVEDDSTAGSDDLLALDLGVDDVVVGISASGRTPYVLGALRAARRVRAATVAITSNPGSVIRTAAEVAIEVVVGPEFLAGSTRLKAGTAQKLVLNMLSTLSMVRLGKTYGNVMVDLQVTNRKLQARAERTLIATTGLSGSEATAALDRAGGSVKVALLGELAGCTPAVAREALARADGHLRSALADLTATAG